MAFSLAYKSLIIILIVCFIIIYIIKNLNLGICYN